MISCSLTFEVHSPYILKNNYNFFSITRDHEYFDDDRTKNYLNELSDKCYLPSNNILLNTIRRYPNEFKCNFLVSEMLLQQLERFRPDVLDSFQELFLHQNVEPVASTGYRTIASLRSDKEFLAQVKRNEMQCMKLFGRKPKVFMNSSLLYSNHISELIAKAGYAGIVTEGTENILGWRSPNFLYLPKEQYKQKLLLKNPYFSNAISYLFSNPAWVDYPLTADKMLSWFLSLGNQAKMVNLVIDYESFGYYQPHHTGILAFLEALPRTLIESDSIEIHTLGELEENQYPVSKLDVEYPISSSGIEKDISSWVGNDFQKSSLEAVYSLEQKIKKVGDEGMLNVWRSLQTIDYFKCMDTRWVNAGYQQHNIKMFGSAEEAYIVYNNVIQDLSWLLGEKIAVKNTKKLVAS